MWVYSCFEGDVDMALCGIQHDCYFASPLRPEASIEGDSTLWWIWRKAVVRAEYHRRWIPWIRRNMRRIWAIDGFDHKLLRLPHEHLAAYHRWRMAQVRRDPVWTHLGQVYPDGLVESWRDFLRCEIPALLNHDDVLVALTKSMVYQQFEEGDRAYFDFQDAIMRRYGYRCVARCAWAEDVAKRAGVSTGRTASVTDWTIEASTN